MDSTLNCAEVMRLLRVSRNTVIEMLERRELGGFKRGKVIRIDGRSVERLLGRQDDSGERAPDAGR
jgi:excisionase family DNA binding protein